MAFLLAVGAKFVIRSDDDFSDYVKLRLMSSKTEHDKIGIGTINTVRLIRRIFGRAALLTNIVHDLMFALSWAVGIRKYHDEILPQWMVLQSILDVFSEFYAYAAEELGSGGDCIRIKFLLVNIIFDLLIPSPCLFKLFKQLYFASLTLLTFEGCSESS